MLKRVVNKIIRNKDFLLGKRKAAQLGITFEKPNYIFKDVFDEKSIVIDVGCADDPDLSVFFMKQFDCFAYAVDPTRKHFAALKAVSDRNKKFQHLPYAVADCDQQLTFYESKENASGSLLQSHSNVQNDSIISYEVEAVTISKLLERIGVDRIDFLKLDLEGAEYSLLEKINSHDLVNVDQLFVEFHHHAIPDKTFKDTLALVKKIADFGYEDFTLDKANYLFYKR